jgi:hypothetical protein
VRPAHPFRTRSLLRSSATALIALALLAAGFGLVIAADDADSGEMTVSVLPSINRPTSPGEEPGGSPQPLARTGTFTAYTAANDRPGTALPSWLTMVVRDERGTAAGWMVVMAAGPEQSGWTSTLTDNRGDMVTLILPPADARAGQDFGIEVGRALGSLYRPMPILHAAQGSGAGVYLQLLGGAWPSAGSDGRGTLFIQIPFAP